MSNAIDDKELDQYLSGSTQYSQRYRSIPADDVPPELDRLVLAQANTSNVTSIEGAVEKRTSRAKSRAFWMRLSAPVALAASIVLVVSLVIDSGNRFDSAPAGVNLAADAAKPASEAPESQSVAANNSESLKLEFAQEAPQEERAEAFAQRERQSASKAASDSLRESAATAAVATQSAREAERKLDAPASGAAAPAPSVVAPTASDQRAATALDKAIVTGQLQRSSPEDSALPEAISPEQSNAARTDANTGPRETIPQTAFAKRKATDEQLTKQLREADPVAWLAYIRELRSTGKSRDADEEWKRFIKVYPNHSVEANDSARPKK